MLYIAWLVLNSWEEQVGKGGTAVSFLHHAGSTAETMAL